MFFSYFEMFFCMEYIVKIFFVTKQYVNKNVNILA